MSILMDTQSLDIMETYILYIVIDIENNNSFEGQDRQYH
jgi:hypothetical protein